MKKLFFIAAISGVALAGCTKNEVTPSADEQNVISFANPVSHVVTKADLIPATYPETESFAVFADYHVDIYVTAATNPANFTPYMRGEEGVVVNHKTTALSNGFDSYWAPEKNYYWPKDGYLTFAAYSPANAYDHADIQYSVANGVTAVDYVVKTDKTNQYDLMLSNRASDQESSDMVTNSPDPYDGVQITFNHALSAIKFAVNTDNDYSVDDYTITLKSLTVKNAFSKGDLTQFADIDSPDAINLSSLWSNQEDEASYEVTSTPADLSTVSTTFSDEDDADLVLLPQNLVHPSPGKNVVVEVVYTVSHPDMGGNSIEYTKDLELAKGSIVTWDAGKRYIYDITIGMDQIVFAPMVTAWDTQTTIEI